MPKESKPEPPRRPKLPFLPRWPAGLRPGKASVIGVNDDHILPLVKGNTLPEPPKEMKDPDADKVYIPIDINACNLPVVDPKTKVMSCFKGDPNPCSGDECKLARILQKKPKAGKKWDWELVPKSQTKDSDQVKFYYTCFCANEKK